MKRIVLISCVSQKVGVTIKARDMYISDWFKKAMKYAEKMNPDGIYILSAKYGLLHLDDLIAPYNLTLNEMSTVEARGWASKVIMQLKQVADLENDEVTFLAGDKYRRYLVEHIKHCRIPMMGMKIGEQKSFMMKQV